MNDLNKYNAFPLTLTHLRFTVEAETSIRLGGWQAGSNLRGALGDVMRRTYCPQAYTPGQPSNDPNHIASCPVCWLLAANEHPGEERRGYALVPPLKTQDEYKAGSRFSFGLTLFGDAFRFLPYFLLAVPEAGRSGVGIGRGRFHLCSVMAVETLQGLTQPVLAEGEHVIHVPDISLGHAAVLESAEKIQQNLRRNGRLEIEFLTPLRLDEGGHLVKVPDFGAFFVCLLKRLDDLAIQFAGSGRRDEQERLTLQQAANQVRLMENNTQWVEIKSGSSRSQKPTWISGFVGKAYFQASPDIWEPLLPWLIWGQASQAGKNVVKGNGLYQLTPEYWTQL